MLKRIAALWTIGTHGQAPRLARQITLTNQIALLAPAMTLPYQAFYVLTGPRRYVPIILANLIFVAAYLCVLPLNRAGRFDEARNLVLAVVYLQLLTVTLLIGTGAGVHLFYFTLGASLGLVFIERRTVSSLAHMTLAWLLYLLCHFAFTPANAVVQLPEAAQHVMYVVSAAGAVFLGGTFSYLFSLEIDRAEQALTISNQELELLSSLDPLTSLANRRTLDSSLHRECGRLRRQGGTLSLLLCDVDCFKAYNDFYGHPAGDACLRRVGEALAACVRRDSDIVARYGGEEFAVVLPATDVAGALRLAEQARQSVLALALPHERSMVGSVVTLSVGIASADSPDGVTPEELLRRADAALYDAKRTGRNRVVSWSARTLA